jgi:hypothetical protein
LAKKKKNSFHVVTDVANGLVYEVWTTNEKRARHLGRFRQWAPGSSHEGLRRILRPSEPWAVVDEEANYITRARERAQRAPEVTPQLTAADLEQLAQRRIEREAAEEAEHAERLVAMRADQADRRERRAALDARLGRHRPIFDLPTQAPDTGEWI